MKFLFAVLLLLSSALYGQIPEGYYNSAQGLSGQPLREALHDIIDGHQEQTYASLWIHFQTTDDNDDGMVWDMYSDIPGGNPAYTYTFVVDQCGNYGAEGDCYNREHSFPKSWFNDAAPMITDLFHIYPTDGYVNGKRSNYPFGEVGSYTWISSNGSKVGNCSYTGYSGVVFEPIDEYKGDFARTYFYMMTRYKDLVSAWNSDMLSGADLADWAKGLLLQWDTDDPVSNKETDRNNAVYTIQNNRNPFIDHPEYAGQIWGNATGIPDENIDAIKVWYTGSHICFETRSQIESDITIYNTLGQACYADRLKSNYGELPFVMENGMYLIVIRSGRNVQCRKLMVVK